MPDWKTHMGISLIFLGGLILMNEYIYPFFNPSLFNLITIIIITLFYSILPDIDTPASKARQWILLLGVLAIIWFAWQQAWIQIILIGIMFLLMFTLKHRGITHSLIACIIFSACIGIYNVYLMPFAFTAYLSHLLADQI